MGWILYFFFMGQNRKLLIFFFNGWFDGVQFSLCTPIPKPAGMGECGTVFLSDRPYFFTWSKITLPQALVVTLIWNLPFPVFLRQWAYAWFSGQRSGANRRYRVFLIIQCNEYDPSSAEIFPGRTSFVLPGLPECSSRIHLPDAKKHPKKECCQFLLPIIWLTSTQRFDSSSLKSSLSFS